MAGRADDMLAPIDAERWLQRLPLFSEIDAESLRRLTAATRVRVLERGALALHAGEVDEEGLAHLSLIHI